MPEGPVDPFATPAEADPFAEGPSSVALADEIGGTETEQTIEPAGIPSEAAAGLPTVDAEGNVIAPAQAPQEPVAVPEAAQAPPVVAPAPAAPAAATPAPAEAAVAPATPPAAGDRPPGPRGGKGEMRHYKLLYVSAEGQFTIADLSKVPDDSGITVVKLDKEPNEKDSKPVPGDVGELWFEARNNEHANRLGFTIMGRPKDGVHIFAVPRGAWKPRFVKPAPPQPARERVVIS